MAVTPRAPDPDFQAAFERALREGAHWLTFNGNTFLIAAPIVRDTATSQPFADKPALIVAPQARAAYSDRVAWMMATLSALAYRTFDLSESEKEAMIRSLADGDFTKTFFFDNKETGTQAFLTVRLGHFMVLAFRGTEKNRKDILNDINARFYNTPSGIAHRGFASAFESVERDIRKALDELKAEHGELPLYITGHSLGGALATAAAQSLEEDYLVTSCCTFGSPRIGTAVWSDSVKSPVYRVVHGADCVPMVPLSGFARSGLMWLSELTPIGGGFLRKIADKGGVGFQHVGDLRFISDSNDFLMLKCGSSAVTQRFSHIVGGIFYTALKAWKPKSLSSLFADHSISRYAVILEQIADKRNPREKL